MNLGQAAPVGNRFTRPKQAHGQSSETTTVSLTQELEAPHSADGHLCEFCVDLGHLNVPFV